MVPSDARQSAKARRCRRLQRHFRNLSIGTGGRTRTDKMLPSADFESAASTNSATPACRSGTNGTGATPRRYRRAITRFPARLFKCGGFEVSCSNAMLDLRSNRMFAGSRMLRDPPSYRRHGDQISGMVVHRQSPDIFQAFAAIAADRQQPPRWDNMEMGEANFDSLSWERAVPDKLGVCAIRVRK